MRNFIEEGAEAMEQDQFGDEFEDVHSSSPGSVVDMPVDPLSYSIAVNDQGVPMPTKSVRSGKSSTESRPSEENGALSESGTDIEKSGKFLPMYGSEVIMPHPSKHAASAWLYPMQMISVPSTEVAFEKGWEPGINKFTLYTIHVSTYCSFWTRVSLH